MHRPVMLKEVVAWLRPHPDGVYIDATVGEGGHSQAILDMAAPSGRIVGFDRDAEAVAASQEALRPFGQRVTLVHERFREAATILRGMDLAGVAGVVLDLGVSSRQLDTPARGFSFQTDGPLDMRMDTRDQVTAVDLINRLPEKELARIIYEFGEERYSRHIARAIVRRRERGGIFTTQQLVEVIRGAVPPRYVHGHLHFATRTFQALRIAVNQELGDLDVSLRALAGLLLPGGRLVVLTFHSLEDRIVKHGFRELSKAPSEFMVLTKRPIRPSLEETQGNPRARSAKLRVLERKEAA